MNTVSTEFEGANLVGTIATFYKDPSESRFKVSLDTAERFRDANLPLVVVDNSAGQSDHEHWVRAAYRQRGAVVLPAIVGGIARQRQQGVQHAVNSGAGKIVGFEPEKPMIADFAPEIAGALDDTDVLVIGRTEESKASVPPVQMSTENPAGWLLQEIYNLPPDSLAGPRGFTVAGAEVLAAYQAGTDPKIKNNWIYMYQTPLAARKGGLRVGGLALNMQYPDVLVKEETGNPVYDNKRFMQFGLQLEHLLAGEGFDPDSLVPGERTQALLEATRDVLPRLSSAKELGHKTLIMSNFTKLLRDRFGYPESALHGGVQ